MTLTQVLSQPVDKLRAIAEAGRVWRANIADLAEMRERIRAEAERQIEEETARRRAVAAAAIHEAIESGASKAALRAETTKDHWDFEAYVDLGKELAEGNVDAQWTSRKRVTK
ncbi:hypothetical protein [Pseudolysinimonas sp.]|uniref:hypothetical protein n=1 Tax=Pseudolysinimonas sp. TaxID=2680009 RepID=UPI003F7DFFCB